MDKHKIGPTHLIQSFPTEPGHDLTDKFILIWDYPRGQLDLLAS